MSDFDELANELVKWITQQGKVAPEVENNRLPSPTFDPIQHRMDTERNLAYGAGVALGVCLLIYIGAALFGAGNRVDGPMRIAVPALMALTGTAFGYYFGKK